MNKKKLLAVLVLIAVLILTSCSGNKQNQESSSPSTKSNSSEDKTKPIEKVDTEEKSVERDNTKDDQDPYEAMETKSITDVEQVLKKLEEKVEKLGKEINSYDLYKENIDKIKASYEEILNENKSLGTKLKENSVEYAQLIIKSEDKADERYKVLENVFDNIYEDAAKDMYDIYDDVMKDMYDAFYDGALSKTPDGVDYTKWSDIRSDEYDLWSETRSDIYDDWSDNRSDIYDFISDLRSEAYDDDEKGIAKEIEKFKSEIDKEMNTK